MPKCMHDVNDVHVHKNPQGNYIHMHDDMHIDNDVPLDPFTLEGHGFVDMVEFNYLVTHTATLEQNLQAINSNFTTLTTLINEVV